MGYRIRETDSFVGTDPTLARAAWDEDLLASEDLIDFAVRCLQRGVDSPSLASLAGLPRSGAAHDAVALLDLAIDELDLTRIDRHGLGVRLLRFHAQTIVDGAVSPQQGCRVIHWTFLQSDPQCPEYMREFCLLDDEYGARDDGYATQPNLDDRVLEAARRAVAAAL